MGQRHVHILSAETESAESVSCMYSSAAAGAGGWATRNDPSSGGQRPVHVFGPTRTTICTHDQSAAAAVSHEKRAEYRTSFGDRRLVGYGTV